MVVCPIRGELSVWRIAISSVLAVPKLAWEVPVGDLRPLVILAAGPGHPRHLVKGGEMAVDPHRDLLQGPMGLLGEASGEEG